MSVKVSIIIKALNEQDNIERVLKSALSAASDVNGEVILADSLSTDDTIRIAKKFPVKIVQLTNHNERCCGIGAQLGYQYAEGEYIYILDADMEIEVNFLRQALVLMVTDHNLAGIGGLLQEMQLENLEFQARVQRAPADMRAGDVNHLSGGGLYRRSAIDEIGYLTNRNLHSYEEFELGIRLRAAGWRLVRLPIVSVKHYGYTMPAYRLLKRRWKSRYSRGLGELIRASFGKNHMPFLMREMTDIKLYLGVIFWWLSLLMILVMVRPWSIMLAMFISLLALPFVAMVIKKRNFPLGVYSVVAWQYLSAGMILGLMRKQINPSELIASNVLN
jgi:glycosyltransferase involved in cell wall biosynthesis